MIDESKIEVGRLAGRKRYGWLFRRVKWRREMGWCVLGWLLYCNAVLGGANGGIPNSFRGARWPVVKGG